MIDAKQTSHNVWHSFCVRPQVKFETQDKDEDVVLVLRAHPITQLPWVLNGISLMVLLIFFNFSFLITYLTGLQLFFINLFVFMMIVSYLYFNFLNYFFNVGIITTKRVIDLDFHAVIYKEFTEARLGRIEDLTAKSSGYFASLFNFGDVFMQTAGTDANIEFLKVPHPQDTVDVINELTPA